MAQVVIRDSWIGPHIKPAPWTDFGTWPWRDARYFEYRDRGPGAEPNADRPQLSESEARLHTAEAYLNGWSPC